MRRHRASHENRPHTAGADRPLMDLPTTAARLGVSHRHIRRLVAERRITYIKWGHLLRFDPDEIDEWLAQSRVPVQR